MTFSKRRGRKSQFIYLFKANHNNKYDDNKNFQIFSTEIRDNKQMSFGTCWPTFRVYAFRNMYIYVRAYILSGTY